MRRLVILFSLFWILTTAVYSGTRIVFSPQWHPQAQFAGYIVAKHLGYYEKEGLDVEIKYPTETVSSLDLMRQGKAHLVTTMLANAIALKASHEMNLVNILQTSQHSSMCLVKKPGKSVLIPASFSKMRVGLWASGLARPAEAMNIIKKLNWQIVPFREGFNLLNYDMVDAISAMEYSELMKMKYSGWDVSNRSVLRLSEHGYDIPEDGVYCMEEYYLANKEAVQAFVRASKKGWEWCRKNPKEAINLIIDEMRNHFIYSSSVIQNASLKIILEKQERTPGKVAYDLTPEQLNKTIKILKDAQFMDTDIDYKKFVAK